MDGYTNGKEGRGAWLGGCITKWEGMGGVMDESLDNKHQAAGRQAAGGRQQYVAERRDYVCAQGLWK